MAARRGTTQHLATMIAKRKISTITDVTRLLDDIHRYTLNSTGGDRDGIACFTLLYHDITATVDDTVYQDRDFLVRLDIEFAKRYFAALTQFAENRESAPKPWRLLFDLRSDPEIQPVQFAVAGVNAHINYDLAPALLATWKHFPPEDGRRRDDYDLVDGIFREHMDGLRERFKAAWAEEGEDGDALDWAANRLGSMIVRHFRANAWDDAMRVWSREQHDREQEHGKLLRELEFEAGLFAGGFLRTPFLQWIS